MMRVSASILFAAALFCANAAQAQSVQITSPADGTTVSPGQTITITVKGSPAVQTALITVEKPLPQVKEIVPLKYSLKIPDDMPEGTFHIRAMAQANGQFVETDKIGLNVEWPEKLMKAEPYPASIDFDAIGENQPLKILGTFEGGRQLDVAHSGKSAYVSTNIDVATVSLNGIVTSLGLGEAKIIFRNSGVISIVPVKVEPINHGRIGYELHMAAASPLSKGDGDDYYVAHVTATNNSTIPLAYVRIEEVKLNDQPVNLLPLQKLNFLMGDKWQFKMGFKADAGPRGSKATLHVRGVYSAVPEFYHKEQPFDAAYTVELP